MTPHPPTTGMHNNHKALNLEELSSWVSAETFEWLREGDEKAAAFQAELDEAGADQLVDLFQPKKGRRTGHDSDDDNDDSCNSDDSNRSDADFEGLHGRIRVWTSSRTDVNGVGGRYRGILEQDHSSAMDPNDDDNDDDDKENQIRIVYVISESWKGYGDLLWASSRHMANTFSDWTKCRDLLGPTFRGGQKQDNHSHHHHPLAHAKVLELGAGCGVPSLMAIKCGARVVCTDLDDPNRIRSLAESMQRNWCEIQNGLRMEDNDAAVQRNGPLARVCPFRWGASSVPVAKCLNDDGTDKFDLICATDCLFMPWLHYDLLKAVDELLAEDGVCIMEFAIHESFSKDEEVWPFVDKAIERDFRVEVLDAVQLTPPRKGMPAKQGLINILRLTREKGKKASTVEET